MLLGTATQYHTVQDHAKVKLAYDFTPTMRASYTLGWWKNDTDSRPATYLRDAAGNPVYSGSGQHRRQCNFNWPATDFCAQRSARTPDARPVGQDQHQGSIRLGSGGQPVRLSAGTSARSRPSRCPARATGGAGRITDMDGTGWHT